MSDVLLFNEAPTATEITLCAVHILTSANPGCSQALQVAMGAIFPGAFATECFIATCSNL